MPDPTQPVPMPLPEPSPDPAPHQPSGPIPGHPDPVPTVDDQPLMRSLR